MSQWQRELEVAVDAAQAAGHAAMRHFTKDPRVTWKSDRSPVSEADHEADAAIVAAIRRVFPDDAILTEESGALPGPSGRRWIVDPIDGTRPFLRGIPHWSNLIALEADGDIVVGVLHLPALGELYSAARGHGTMKDGVALHVRQTPDPEHAFLTMGQLDNALLALGRDTFLKLVDGVSLARGYGDAWGPALVLSGVVDAWMECDVHLWDIAPFPVLFEEAGARYSDLDGVRRWPTHSGFAANPVLHAKLIQVMGPVVARSG